jgi:D-alanine-D-alanine ligase
VPFDFYSECDSPATVEAIAGALRAYGHQVHLVEASEDLPTWFLTHPVDAVFNIAEGTHGQHRESFVPAILESLGIPFTGSDSLTLALALDKARTKQVLTYEGVKTPAWQLFSSSDEPLNPSLSFPLIVKPNHEGSAKGVWRESVVHDEPSLRRQIRRIHERYHQEALVEEFVEGLELTVGVLGNGDPRALPVLEIDFSSCGESGEFFYSWRMKEYQGHAELGLTPTFHCPARLEPELAARVQAIAVKAHQALGCLDLSRTDIRLRCDGTPFVLEVNPLPGLDPFESNFPIMTTSAGIAYPALINHLVDLALLRCREDAQTQEPSSNLSCAPARFASQSEAAGAGRPARGEPGRSLSVGQQGGRVW